MTPIYLIALAVVVTVLAVTSGMLLISLYLPKDETDEIDELIRKADSAMAKYQEKT